MGLTLRALAARRIGLQVAATDAVDADRHRTDGGATDDVDHMPDAADGVSDEGEHRSRFVVDLVLAQERVDLVGADDARAGSVDSAEHCQTDCWNARRHQSFPFDLLDDHRLHGRGNHAVDHETDQHPQDGAERQVAVEVDDDAEHPSGDSSDDARKIETARSVLATDAEKKSRQQKRLNEEARCSDKHYFSHEILLT